MVDEFQEYSTLPVTDIDWFEGCSCASLPKLVSLEEGLKEEESKEDKYSNNNRLEVEPLHPLDKFTNWLFERYPDVHILQIAYTNWDSEDDNFKGWLGVLLLPLENEEWARLGICEFDLTGLDEEKMDQGVYGYLKGSGEGWGTLEGIYGYIRGDYDVHDD